MEHAESVILVNKYQSRLDPGNDVKKILRALNKLHEVKMTIEILQETGVGKAVNNLRKSDSVGDLARKIVACWKTLLPGNGNTKGLSTKLQYSVASTKVSNNDEYDPSGNWEMKKQKLKVKHEAEDDQYDPTQNWKMMKLKSGEDITEKPLAYYFNEKPKKEKIKPSPRSQKQSTYDRNSSHGKKSQHNERNDLQHNLLSPADEQYTVDDDNDDGDDYGRPSYIPSVQSTTLYSGDTNSNSYSTAPTLTHSTNSETPKKKSKTKKSSNKEPMSDFNKQKQNNEDSDFFLPPTNPCYAAKETTKRSLNENRSTKQKVKRKSAPSECAPAAKKGKADDVAACSKQERATTNQANEKSFEDFMMMDTNKIARKKKKKVVSKSANASNTAPSKREKLSDKPKIELHLPEIQSVYRPLPTNHALPERHPAMHPEDMTDAMAAELHSQRNTKRMQIYSGHKTSMLPKMLSLYDQCMNVLMNNIDKLDVIGVPYDIIKPVLERCTAEQLYRLEDLNLYLLEDTDELWEKLSRQEFRGHQPEELESWREVYLRLHDAREEKLARLTQTIQAKAKKAKPLEKRTKLAYVGLGEAKAPRNVLRAQLKYGTAGRKSSMKPIKSSRTLVNGEAASAMKDQATELRMSVPIGSITAATVDGPSSRASFKKQAPRAAPMMAKTLKSINKLRYRR